MTTSACNMALHRRDSIALVSAPAPVAAHMRHDHRAAGAIFLHIGGVALADRIGTGIVTGIDAIRTVIGRDAQAGRRPLTRRREIVSGGRLGEPDPGSRGL